MSDSSSSEDLFADMTGLGDAASDDDELNEGLGEVEPERMREAERAAMARWEAGQRAREKHAAMAEATAATAKLDLFKPSPSSVEVTSAHNVPTTSALPEAELGIEAALCVENTGRFACSVETCLASAHTDAVAVGTYQLDEAAGRRDGNVQLYRVALEEHPRFRAHGDQEDDKADDIGSNSVGNKSVKCGGSNTDGKGDECTSRACLVPCGQLEMPSGGVLDCKWEPGVSSNAPPRLACSTANGSLVLLSLHEHWRHKASRHSSSSGSNDSSGDGSESGSNRSPFSFDGASTPAGHLFLSLDWNNRSPLFRSTLSPKLAVGEALGCVSIWRANNISAGGGPRDSVGGYQDNISAGDSKCSSTASSSSSSSCGGGGGDGTDGCAPVLERRWLGHTLCGEPSEVWSVAFDPSAPDTLLASGADDACLKLWDLRTASGTSPNIGSSSNSSSNGRKSDGCSSSSSGSSSSSSSSSGVFGCAPGLAACVKGAHHAGVTSLAFAPSERWPHVLASGSYDGTVRLWDLRMLTDALPVSSGDSDRNPVPGSSFRSGREPIASALAGGGCWRLKWRSDGALLVGAMHGGASVLRLTNNNDNMNGNNSNQSCNGSDQHESNSYQSVSAPNIAHIHSTGHGVRLEGVARYLGHESMAYGADWCSISTPAHAATTEEESDDLTAADRHPVAGNMRSSRSQGLCATCSFYDHALHLWPCPI